MRPRLALAAAVLLGLVGLSGCGEKEAAGNRIRGDTLTIYSSVPLRGASRVSGLAVINGARMALADVRGRVGRYRIVFRQLDDTSPQSVGWDPGQTSENARRAVADRTTIGYIGELDSGSSAISIPLLNRAGIAQISPASTAVGLTSDAAGSLPGEPQKYYPTAERTFARVVPDDEVQASVQARLQRSLGCTDTYVVDDGEFDGQEMAASFDSAAPAAGLRILATQSFLPKAANYTAFAASVAQSGANCVLISADTENNATLVTRQIAAALPRARIFGSAGVAESTFTEAAQGGIPAAIDPRVLITVATLGPKEIPAAGRQFLAAYASRYGPAQPYAIYGYEAMSLMLDAIQRATDHGRSTARRSKVVAAIFATRHRQSVLGEYSVDRNGDTTLSRYGVYKVIAGRLTFWKAIDA